MVEIQGVDYSRTPGSNWLALATVFKSKGIKFVGRYAVTDKSPTGRGMSGAEYAAMTAAGIDTFMYWEQSEGWMLGGFNAGVTAAKNAVANIAIAGMPSAMPVYFAHDIDPQESHFARVDDCLRGAASVIGAERCGIYGGWKIIDHCFTAKTAAWFCQTVAWKYQHGWHAANHLEQYDTVGNLIGGVDCDLVRAVKPIYGQASAFQSGPPIVPHDPHKPTVPWDKDDTGPKKIGDTACLAFLGEITAKKDVEVRATATRSGKGIVKVKAGERVTARGSTRNKSGLYYFVDLGEEGVGRAVYSSFFERFPLP